MAQQIKVTEEFLKTLPIVQINCTGDIPRYARYDKENNRVYLLDSEGKFSGKVADADKMVKITEEKTSEESTAQPIKENIVDTEETTIQEEKRNKPKWLGLVLIGIAVVAVVVVGIVLGKASRIVKDKTQAPSSEPSTQVSTQPTQAPTEPATETVPERTVQVLSCVSNLLPGHVLTQEDIRVETISEIEYRLLAGICGHYTEVDTAALIGQSIVSYVPAGTYLNYNNIAANYVPINPWVSDVGSNMVVSLNVSASDGDWGRYLWGTRATIRIEAQTKITTENAGEEPQDQDTLPSGIKYSNSVVESMILDTYELSDVLIIDTLDTAGNSLFAKYVALAQVPSGHLSSVIDDKYATVEACQELTPATIMISLPQEEANLISAIKADNLRIFVDAPIQSVATDVQMDTYVKTQNIARYLAQKHSVLKGEA